jgi:hypothetical protein
VVEKAAPALVTVIVPVFSAATNPGPFPLDPDSEANVTAPTLPRATPPRFTIAAVEDMVMLVAPKMAEVPVARL